MLTVELFGDGNEYVRPKNIGCEIFRRQIQFDFCGKSFVFN